MKTIYKIYDGAMYVLLALVIIVCYIPYAIFKAFFDRGILEDYFDVWRRISDFLRYPIVQYEKRKNHYEKLKRQRDYYIDECGRLNNIIEELKKNDNG